jgi:hypothetical protein
MYLRLRKFIATSLTSFCAAIAFALMLCLPCPGQTGDATLGGVVEDSTGAVVSHVAIKVTNVDTGTERNTATNDVGLFNVLGLNPGRYSVHVEHAGFADVEVNDITLNVGDKRQLDIKLPLGNAQETVTVDDNVATIDTTDASVSTVIDRQFVRDIPLNGRSFQNLILLSPGVVTNSPQGGDDGEFSVNGMRSNSNYHMVDGVSAQNQAYNWGGVQSAGMGANSTAVGTTQSILPVDAMQEFRIVTSTYSAEYGRQPGAQISIQSRSGTSTYHGEIYEFLRNTAFDANSWFNTYSTPAIARPAEHQNDFGGTIGGPILVPRLFTSRNRMFFFGAYEGLRLTQPINATIYYVPSNGTWNTATTYADVRYKNLRQYANAALKPVLNAFPLPNCSTAQNPQCVDFGDGLSPYLFSSSAPSSVNSTDVRLDFQVLSGTHIFARYGDTTGKRISHIGGGPHIQSLIPRNRAYVLGVDSAFGGNIGNELRLQYSTSSTLDAYNQDLSGGSTEENLNTLQGLPAVGGESYVKFEFASGDEGDFYAAHLGSKQFQPNAVDTVSWTRGVHIFKGGVDYRQTTAYLGYKDLSRGPSGFYVYDTADEVLNNEAHSAQGNNPLRQDPTAKNLGIFVQDQWRVNQRLTLNLGLRWDLNPPPSISGAQQYTYSGNIHNPSSLMLSKLGAPLYKTTYKDIQPRVGAALRLHSGEGQQTVLRAGGGLFYDLVALNQAIGSGESIGPGSTIKYTSSAKQPFPIPTSTILAPADLPPPPFELKYVADLNLAPPTVIQWNVSLEQQMGKQQSFTIGYVGSAGKNLIIEDVYSVSKYTPVFTSITQYENGPGSSYNALQVKYRRQPFHGLQVLANYTWSHALDSSSTDNGMLSVQRGNSNHDVRHNFTAAMVYNVPGFFQNRFAHYLASGWSYDLLAVIRSAFPVQAAGATFTDPANGEEYVGRLNYNGKNPYVYKAGIPGGRQFDPTVFSVPLSGVSGIGTAPRNFLRGFGEFNADTALQRTFALHGQLRLLFRAEAFNVFNHPSFGALDVSCGTSTAGAVCNNPLMGQSTNTLATALSSLYGPGGLASIYQQGGPRSLQFTVKVQF